MTVFDSSDNSLGVADATGMLRTLHRLPNHNPYSEKAGPVGTTESKKVNLVPVD
jgi:hypothetical protein